MDANDLIKSIKKKQFEKSQLLDKLDRAMCLQGLLRKHGVTPDWPIKITFSGNVHSTDVWCSISQDGTVILRLFYEDVPLMLWPERLKKDMGRI